MSKPKLQRPVDEEVHMITKYISDPDWSLEQKMDGARVVAILNNDVVTLLNREGNPLGTSSSAKRAALEAELASLDINATLDGELMEDGTYHVFDIVAIRGMELIKHTWSERVGILDTLFAGIAKLEHPPELITRVAIADTFVDKEALWDAVRASGAEGVVAKHKNARLSERKTTESRKIKLTRTVDAIVTGFVAGKDSATCGVFRNGHVIDVGKFSLIGKPFVEEGDVVEVEYLYVKDATKPNLVQPRMVRVRSDKPPQDCTIDQFNGTATCKDVVAF